MKSALALKLIQYVNKLHNGLLNVTEIVTDDDSTMHDHCKHKNRGGKLTNNIPEPIFRTNSSNCIKVMCKPIFVMVSNTKNPYRFKNIDAMRIKRYITYYVEGNRRRDLDSFVQNTNAHIEHIFNNHTWCGSSWCWTKDSSDKMCQLLINTMSERVEVNKIFNTNSKS